MTKLTFATTRLRERRVRRDAGIDDRDADALPVHARDAEQPDQQRVSGARLIRRRRRVRDHRRAVHAQIAGQMVATAPSRDRSLSSALFARTTAAPRIRLTTLQPVTRGQQLEVAIRPVHDDALARGRLARLMSGEISGEVRPPVAVRALLPCSPSEEKATSAAATTTTREVCDGHEVTQGIRSS